MINESIYDDDPNSNEIVLEVNRTDPMDYLNRNRGQSPTARTLSGNEDESEKGKPSWPV